MRPKNLVTVAFADEDEYVRFTDFAFESGALWFTSKPVSMSVDITPEFFEQTRGQFAMHLVTPEEVARELASLKGTRPFDVESIRGRHVPGSHFEK